MSTNGVKEFNSDTQPEHKMEEATSIKPEGWENPPTLQDLKADLTAAENSHNMQVAKIDHWLDHLNITGSAKRKPVKNRSNVQPKLIRKQAEWRYPALSEPFLSADGMFKASPRTWEDKKRAQQNQLILNYQFETQLDKVSLIDRYIRTAVDEGTVIIRTGWNYESETITEQEPLFNFVADSSLEERFMELEQFKQENPTEYAEKIPPEVQEAHRRSMEQGVPLRPVPTGEISEITVEKILKNHPTAVICDNRNVIIDPSCEGNYENARFFIHKFETSLSDLKKEGKYTNLDHINTNTAPSPLEMSDYQGTPKTDFEFKDDARKRLVAYEYWGYWDYENNGITKPFVCTWVGNVMIRLEETPYSDKKLPFIVVAMRPNKDSVYGDPDGDLLEDNQAIIGAVTRGMIDLMGKSANGQTAYRKNVLDYVNRRKMEKGEDFEFGGQYGPQESFYTFQFPEIPASAFNLINQQTMEAESMTGTKAFSEGINSSSLGEVAAGIRGVLDAASKREVSILRRLARGIEEVGRRFISMNAEFLNEEEVIRITNEQFETVRRDDLGGEIDLKVDISSAEEDNAKAQELAFMLQTMGNSMPLEMSQMVLADIAKLRKMPTLAHKIENYQPQPDPIAEENKMLENELLKAKIAHFLTGAEGNETGAQLDLAKARKEIAMASRLISEKDLKDLDFIEQESGVKQERQKELHGEQARSNIQRDIIKSQLKRAEDASAAIIGSSK